MPYPSLWRSLSQAGFPVLMAVLVVMLIVFALVAHDRRKCREVCIKAGHADYSYKRERFDSATCDCITRDGRTIAAPPVTR